MKILFVTDIFPYPPVSGDTIRVYNLLRRVASKHRVWFLSILSPNGAPDIVNLKEFCWHAEAVDIPRQNPIAHLPGLLRFAASGKPLELKFLESGIIKNRIQEISRQEQFDIINIEHSRMAYYREFLAAGVKTRQVLGFHNVAFTQYERIHRIQKHPVQKFRSWLHGLQMRHWEPAYAERFDHCTVVSDLDRDILLAANPCLNVTVIPNGVDSKVYRPLPRPMNSAPSILFIGSMDYPPVEDAVFYFVRDIFPKIRKAVPDVELWLVGKNPSESLVELAGEAIHVTGRVDDILSYYKRCSVCVVPLRAGGGTRLKILEAMALGRPMVSTSIGCEGLNVVNHKHLLVADDPEQFSQQTVRLLTDESLYLSLVEEARQLVVSQYDWDILADQLIHVYEGLMP